jgi:hypothetical protein
MRLKTSVVEKMVIWELIEQKDHKPKTVEIFY